MRCRCTTTRLLHYQNLSAVFDLLLVDINMPKMNGFEFAKEVLALDVNVNCVLCPRDI